jgi:hypothetical protein
VATTFNVTGTATNTTTGQSSPFSGSFTDSAPPVINSVTITPQAAAPGTLRTITISATDPNTPASPLSYTCLVNGTAATATSQPNVFTFVG